MKRIISFVLAAVMLTSMMLTSMMLTCMPVTAANTLPSTDVAADAWYYDAVASVYESGLMKGKT